MKYYMNYKLEAWPETKKDEIKNKISQKAKYNVFNSCVNEWYSWNSWEQDMAEVSEEFPDVLIQIICDGMNASDLWTSAYLAGHKVFDWRADATIPSPPQELIDKVTAMDRDRLNQRQQALQKLTPQERRLLGLEE